MAKLINYRRPFFLYAMQSKAIRRTNFGTLGREIKNKLNSDNDAKVIIQGANSQTGIGKTTLAILLCRFIDPEWDAESKAFIDVQEYLNAHLDYPKGSALLLDEIEAGADSRRSTSTENVNLSQGWAKLRSRNIATVCTLPSISMLDKRMMELADYWVLVRKRGVAQPYRIEVNDFAPHRAPSRQAFDGEEHIRFADLPDDDPDKRYLDSIKDDHIRGDSLASIPVPEHEKKLKQAKQESRKEMRNEMMRDMYSKLDVSYADISNLETVDMTKQGVGVIIRDE